MFVIMAVATDTRAVGAAAAIAIGGTVGLDALFGGPVTGASMNPARSFGPALASGQWHEFWIYVIGPVLGTVLGALAYQVVRGEHAGPGARGRPPLGNRDLRFAAHGLVGLRAAVAGVGAATTVEQVGTRPAEELVVAVSTAEAVAGGAAQEDVVAAQGEDAVAGLRADQAIGAAGADPVDELALAAHPLVGALVAAPAERARDAALVGDGTGARARARRRGVAGVDRRAARKQRVGERGAAVVGQERQPRVGGGLVAGGRGDRAAGCAGVEVVALRDDPAVFASDEQFQSGNSGALRSRLPARIVFLRFTVAELRASRPPPSRRRTKASASAMFRVMVAF